MTEMTQADLDRNARESHLAIVIRKDGTVPFDADVHPIIKQRVLGHIAAAGHTIGPHLTIAGAHMIANWHPDKVKSLEPKAPG